MLSDNDTNDRESPKASYRGRHYKGRDRYCHDRYRTDPEFRKVRIERAKKWNKANKWKRRSRTNLKSLLENYCRSGSKQREIAKEILE